MGWIGVKGGAERSRDVTMKPTAVLILSHDENSYLLEPVFSIGLAPVVRGNMEEALDRLRHDRFAMILVDRSRADVDVLEFILNVRDINATIPVAVVGEPSAGGQVDKILWAQPRTYVIDKLEDQHRIVQYLERVLGAQMWSDG
jgi:CheY-like chemotaxis protein